MHIKEILEKKSNLKVSLKIAEYKSTYIRIFKDRFNLKISLHKLFTKAPKDVEDAIVSFCLKRDKKSFTTIKNYAIKHFHKLDYTHKLNINKLITKGGYFDLQQIYDNLNKIYFNDRLKLFITWFEKPTYKKFRHVTFGSYDKNMKLIRINKLLDRSDFPFYFINYIVYHEMLHSICEEQINEKGQRKIHTKTFAQEERKFAYFKEAVQFKKKIFDKDGGKWQDIANGQI